MSEKLGKAVDKIEVKFVLASGTKDEFEAKLNDEENEEFASNYKNGAIVFIKESNVIYCDGKYYNEFLLPITSVELKELKDESKLIPGLKYKVTDYTCNINAKTTDNYKSGKHAFDIVVMALSPNELDNKATAMIHLPVNEDEEIDDYFASCNLSEWELKYELTDGYEGGLITYMKDEYGNEAPYDFKNILFKRYQVLDTGGRVPPFTGFFATSATDAIYKGSAPIISSVTVDTNTTKWFYTFVGDLSLSEVDGSVTGVAKYNVCENISFLSNTVIAGSYNKVTNSYNVTIVGHDNVVNGSTNIVLMGGNYNHIDTCSILLWNTLCNNNSVICTNNVLFASNCFQNTIKCNKASSTLNISLGNNSRNNVIQNDAQIAVSTGAESHHNNIINCTGSIALYGNAYHNNIRTSSNIRFMSNYIWYNDFDGCSDLTLSSYCQYNTFEKCVGTTSFGSYVLHCTFYDCNNLTLSTGYIYSCNFNGCSYLTLSYMNRCNFYASKYLKRTGSAYFYYLDCRNAGTPTYSTSNYCILNDIVETATKYTLRILEGYPAVVLTDIPVTLEIEYIP